MDADSNDNLFSLSSSSDTIAFYCGIAVVVIMISVLTAGVMVKYR